MGWTETPDAMTIEHLARLEDRAERLAGELDRDGLTLRRPLVSPRGEVVGEEHYPHPALTVLRALDRQLVELRAALGLDPA